VIISSLKRTRPHRHKTFEYSQGNSQLKYCGVGNILDLDNILRLKYVQTEKILSFSRTQILKLRIFLRMLKNFMTLGLGLLFEQRTRAKIA
jgi:hypothetical protein